MSDKKLQNKKAVRRAALLLIALALLVALLPATPVVLGQADPIVLLSLIHI